MRRAGIALVALLLSCPSGIAYGWGAVERWCPTHQQIDTQAYFLLKQDPALQGSRFPPLEAILAHEGVQVDWDGDSLDATGPGPDVPGQSPYSSHYYNPATQKGGAPEAVAAQMSFLLTPGNSVRARGAAWAAHFLADMGVPYHIVGLPKSEAVALSLAGQPILSVEQSGPLWLYDASMSGQPALAAGWGRQNNFAEALRFFIHHITGEDADWYDPWYGNGTGNLASQKIGTSSHVTWERAAGKRSVETFYPYGEGRYNPVWQNAEHDSGWDEEGRHLRQSSQARPFTHLVAEFTRERMADIYRNPSMGLHNAARNVATLWRASITGLRPELFFSAVPGHSDRCRVQCRIINRADAEALNPIVRLTLREGGRMQTFHARVGERISPGGAAQAEFEVEVVARRAHEVTLQAVASYSIPDLQYAAVSRILVTGVDSPPPPPVVAPPESRPVPPPSPVDEGVQPDDVWRGSLDRQQVAAVLGKKTPERAYERYEADDMTMRIDPLGNPLEMLGSIRRVIGVTTFGKGYRVTYTFETTYTANSPPVAADLRVDRRTRKTTTMVTFKASGKEERKTTVENTHDPRCKVKVLHDPNAPGEWLVILPHASGNAPDVPWRLRRLHP